MFMDFKKKAIEVLYADPQAIDKKSKKYHHISFTTQEAVANTLKIDNSDVSRYTKDLNKYYQYQLITKVNSKHSAIQMVKSIRSKCLIVTKKEKNDITKKWEVNYLIFKIVGSKLGNSHIDWFKYKKKCEKKISGRVYQILDSDQNATNKKRENEVMSRRQISSAQNVKLNKQNSESSDFITTKHILTRTLEHFKLNDLIINNLTKKISFNYLKPFS